MHSDEWYRFLEACIHDACVFEATARKPGNVHPHAAFDDVCFADFVRSAEVTAPVLAQAGRLGVGVAIRQAVVCTQQAVGRNTNLGIILLLAPLAATSPEGDLLTGITDVLDRLSVDDARECYEAICLAHPGGLGQSSQEDVHQPPRVTLREAMRLAADRDLVARQFACGYHEVLEQGVPRLVGDLEANGWETATIRLHLWFMSRYPDSLIIRKCGADIATEAAGQAQQILDAGWPETQAAREMLATFDRWLRADGHRRNPGTSADLVAATLFAVLRDKRVPDIHSPRHSREGGNPEFGTS